VFHPADRVLVAVMNNRRDFEIARDEGWYRIPVKHAPPGTTEADDLYYKMQLGPLIRLERPIPSLRWRRIAFIETTWDRFVAAREVRDLLAPGTDGRFVTLMDAEWETFAY